MNTTTKIDLAVETAEHFMAKEGYAHGPCLSASLRGNADNDCWQVEFAYEGLMDRSATSDPASIVLLVNLKRDDVRSIELM